MIQKAKEPIKESITERAIVMYTKSIADDPDSNNPSYFYRGLAYLGLKKRKEALSDLKMYTGFLHCEHLEHAIKNAEELTT